jgi:hypothetical protein
MVLRQRTYYDNSPHAEAAQKVKRLQKGAVGWKERHWIRSIGI